MDYGQVVTHHVPTKDPPAPDGTLGEPSAATMIDLYKLEYTTAATRYDNIFKALWQNFNYLAVG